jgi:hypothetical protein
MFSPILVERCLGPVFRLDYVSCILTIVSTILIGKRYWGGWLLAGVNSVIICIIGLRTAQFGFIPANLFCIVLYGINVWSWRAEVPAQKHGLAQNNELVTDP